MDVSSRLLKFHSLSSIYVYVFAAEGPINSGRQAGRQAGRLPGKWVVDPGQMDGPLRSPFLLYDLRFQAIRPASVGSFQRSDWHGMIIIIIIIAAAAAVCRLLFLSSLRHI